MPATTAGAHGAPRPLVLLILDGFGVREAAPDNAISVARMHSRTIFSIARTSSSFRALWTYCCQAIR